MFFKQTDDAINGNSVLLTGAEHHKVCDNILKISFLSMLLT